MHLIEVAFKGNRKEFFSWDADEPLAARQAVIVEADRGEDLGRIHSTGELAQRRCGGCAHGCGAAPPARRILRLASPDDVRRHDELRAQDEDARRKAMEKVKVHGLVMKVSDAEWQWDRKKLTFYFTADKRVDFRSLVRDLAATFRTRIELKQIGVRDEARRLTGIGRCGREYCSASWLPELRPVNLQVAKDQRLSLNPLQISGACGRLMCCLRFEHEYYVTARKRFPKEGRILVTARGEEKVAANDIFNDRVTLRAPDGETRVVPLAELRAEMEALSPLAVGGGAGNGGASGGGNGGAAAAPAAPWTADLDESHDDGGRDGEGELAGEEGRPARGARRPPRRGDAPREGRDRPRQPPRGGVAPGAALGGAEPPPPAPAPAVPADPSARQESGDEVMRGGYPGARRRGRRGGRRNRPGGEGPHGATNGE